MPLTPPHWERVDFAPGELRPNEVVLHHWPSPHGLGMVTSFRLILATHPHPLHRRILWSEDLERIRSFNVVESAGFWTPQLTLSRGIGAFATGATGWCRLEDEYRVEVDSVMVFYGHPDHCGYIQRWIDEAVVARRTALGLPLAWGVPAGGETPTI